MLLISRPEKKFMSLLRQPSASSAIDGSQDNDDESPDPSPTPEIQLTKACNFFTILPCEVVRVIFSHLTFTDALNCLTASPLWYNFIVSDIMERVPLDPSLIHKSTMSKWPTLSIGGPISQDHYDVILGLLGSTFHSTLCWEAIEFRSLCFSKLDFSRMCKTLRHQAKLSMICLHHVDITVNQLRHLFNTCPNLSQVVIDSSHIRSEKKKTGASPSNHLIKNDHIRPITSSKLSFYSRRSTTTTTNANKDDCQSPIVTQTLFPHLTHLELLGCTIIDQTVSTIIEGVIRCCCSLEHLVVEGCKGPVSLVPIFDVAVKSCPDLKTFKAQFLPTTRYKP